MTRDHAQSSLGSAPARMAALALAAWLLTFGAASSQTPAPSTTPPSPVVTEPAAGGAGPGEGSPAATPAPAAPPSDESAPSANARPIPAAAPDAASGSAAPRERAAALAGGASAAELDTLIGLLENQTARDDLLAKLKALRTAVSGEAAGEPSVPAEFVAVVSREFDARLTAIVTTAQAVVGALGELPFLFDWLQFQVTNDFRRLFWTNVLKGVGMMLAAGIVLASLLALLVRRSVHRLRPAATAGLSRRIILRALAFLLDIFPAVGFLAAASLVLRVQPLSTITVAAGQFALLALALFHVLYRFTQHAFDPADRQRRWAALNDDQARQVGSWLRRVGSTAIFGYFGLRAADRLGLPPSVSIVLSHLLFVTVAVMLTIWLVRARQPIERFVRQTGEAAIKRPLLRTVVPWELLATSGFLLVIVLVWAHYFVWAISLPGGFAYLLGATSATIGVFVLVQVALLGLGRLAERLAPPPQPAEDGGEVAAAGAGASGGLLFALASTLIKLLAGLAVVQAWGADILGWVASPSGQAVFERVLRIGIILAVALAIWFFLNRWIMGYISARDSAGNLTHSNRSRTLANIGRNVLLVAIALFAGATVLSEIGVDTAPLIAGAGVIGLAIGFGAQTLVKDIITGLFILLGDTMRVGDVVTLSGRGGAVEAMSMRAATLRDYSGAVHTIPYSSIDVVTNLTKDFAFWVFNVNVAYKEDVDQVIEILRGIDEQIRKEWPYRRLILEPLEIAGLDKFGPSEVVVLARVKTRPGDQWRVGREMQRRIKLEFDRRKIEMPFPHQTLYFGTAKDGRGGPVGIEAIRSEILAREHADAALARPAALPARPAPAR